MSGRFLSLSLESALSLFLPPRFRVVGLASTETLIRVDVMSVFVSAQSPSFSSLSFLLFPHARALSSLPPPLAA